MFARLVLHLNQQLNQEIKTDATHTDEAGQGFDDETSVSQEGVLFVNSYLPRVSLNLEILKKYQDKDTGRDIPISEGEFKFALTPTGDAPMPEDAQEGRSIVSTDTDGKVIWPEIEYTKVGEWDYTIQEQDPGDSNIIWDEEAHKVHVSVTRDADYVLHAKWTWGDENLDAADAIISNFRLSAVHLPSTGGDGTGLWLALGLALMVMGVSWYSLYRRARREA